MIVQLIKFARIIYPARNEDEIDMIDAIDEEQELIDKLKDKEAPEPPSLSEYIVAITLFIFALIGLALI